MERPLRFFTYSPTRQLRCDIAGDIDLGNNITASRKSMPVRGGG